MASPTISQCSTLCIRSLSRRIAPQITSHRSIVTLERARGGRYVLPEGIPEKFWSQLPMRLRPDKGRQPIKLHKSPPSELEACKNPVEVINEGQMSQLDPSGARARLFDPKNPEGAKPGDVILTTFKTGDPFSGVALSIKWRGPHTSVLLRNQLTRVGTEMDVKVFSPLVKSMEIAQRATRRIRRARLYYLRKPEHDMGSVQKIVDQYLRQRALLMGGRAEGSKRSGSGKSKSR